MDLGIAGKRALVCGASKGLGYACAHALAAEGVSVALVSRDAQRLASAAKKIERQTGSSVSAIVSDLSIPQERQRVAREFPGPDILVTNCGGPPSGDFRELTRAQWLAALEANFLASIELIQSVVDGMSSRGFGRIVNITSMTVRVPVANLDLSNATRLALTGYVAGVARQMAPTGLTINNLLPGPIATERLQELGETAQGLIARIPVGRAGTPEEFGAVCAFLCSRKAAFITGQNILIDGGLCALTI